MSKTCKNCQYAMKADEKGDGYICRRFPPVPLMVPQHNAMTNETGMALQGFFPPVGPDNWCGEFAPMLTEAG